MGLIGMAPAPAASPPWVVATLRQAAPFAVMTVAGAATAGLIAGSVTVAGVSRGYVMDAAGRVTIFDAPCPMPRTARGVTAGSGTRVHGMNEAGQIVGAYSDGTGDHGFLRGVSGLFTWVDHPQAGPGGTLLMGSTASGQAVGIYKDAAGGKHGFLRAADGAFTPVQPPEVDNSGPAGINAAGEIVGTYKNLAGRRVGFLRDPSGAFVTIVPPGAAPGTDVLVTAINDAGLAVVNHVGVDGRRHASLRDRAGRLTPVPLPAGWEFAILYAIDNAGQVYGLNIADMACFIARPGPVD